MFLCINVLDMHAYVSVDHLDLTILSRTYYRTSWLDYII